jgi:hypothetical protein
MRTLLALDESVGPLLRGASVAPVRDSFLYEYETDSVYPVVSPGGCPTRA